MLSVFFSKANTASAVSGLIWFVSYSAYAFTMAMYTNLNLYEKMLLSLLSNTGMAFGFQIINRLEGTGEGLQWSNFWRPVSIDDNITVGLITVMLLVCTILYLLIALYFEKILPSQYGVPQVIFFDDFMRRRFLKRYDHYGFSRGISYSRNDTGAASQVGIIQMKSIQMKIGIVSKMIRRT